MHASEDYIHNHITASQAVCRERAGGKNLLYSTPHFHDLGATVEWLTCEYTGQRGSQTTCSYHVFVNTGTSKNPPFSDPHPLPPIIPVGRQEISAAGRGIDY